MDLEEKILKAREDEVLRNEVLGDYMNFILSSAGKALGRRITKDDDACSVAMLAFNEAIDKFDASKGKFLSFAGLCVNARIKDWLRQEYRQEKAVIPFSSIGSPDDDESEFDIEDPKAKISDAAIEIECLNEELIKYDISFFELPKYSPKSFRTRRGCKQAIKYIMENREIIEIIRNKHTLPAKRLVNELKINEKLLERHRKYIIACIVILDGEYEIISEYIKFAKKGGIR